MQSIKKAVAEFLDRKGSSTGLCLAKVYRHWPDIVGHEIARMAHPMGHRKRSLIIGVADSVTMQELSLYAPLLLERIDEYLGKNIFDNIKFELLKGRIPLDMVRLNNDRERPPLKGPRDLGRLLDTMTGDSPVARCYRTYVKRMTEKS